MTENTHVLLVDDESDFTDPIAFWLKSKGYTVSVTTNGEDAIKIIKEQSPHIVFLDINLPGMDGLEILKRVREFNKDLPIIMVTAYTDEEKFAKAQELKTSGFFSKDKSLEDLQKTIQISLRIHKGLKPEGS